MTKKVLGRGLDALINGGIVRSVAAEASRVEVSIRPFSGLPGTPSEPLAERSPHDILHLELDRIERNRFQPRTEFDADQLRELANSIKQRGVVQPLLVRPLTGAAGPARYELIAGERRWRAAREAGLTTIPAIVREATDREALEIALIENLQREDLNPIEEARAYEQLLSQFGLTQEQIADQVARSRAGVANALRLLSLPAEVQAWVADHRLSVGHAKVILGLASPEEQRLVAERILKRNLTVRQTEQLVEQLKGIARAPARVLGTATKLPQVTVIEERLQQKLGTRVQVRHGKKKGRIEIEYYGNDDLSRLLGLLGIDNL